MNKSSPVYVLLFVMAVSVVFGIGLSGVHHATLNTLAKNETLHRNRTLSRAFLLDVTGDSAEAYQQAIDRSLEVRELVVAGRSLEVFATRSPREQLVGFRFSGLGFWGPITGIAVFSDNLQTMVNIQFLEHQETPGLGGRIEEPWFTDQFKGLKIAWNKEPDERIIVGGTVDPKAKNRVDAITGASQTSMALMKSLNTELALFQKAYNERTLQ
jgi:Na+-transporting NADH:ubiquinone oxidoreductase subunit C